MKARGAANGLVIHRGYVVAEWGDTTRVDMTFSVTKTFLTTVVGLAVAEGPDPRRQRPVRGYMPPDVDLFDAPHNQTITWDHLLRQTSDWQGTLWGKPDWADRPEGQAGRWPNRKLSEPGTRYKYNDVRVNVLALAALHVMRRPLPDVLREEVMEPIGASSHVALARLRELVDRARRPQDAVGDRRRPLGRRHVHQRLGHGALRLPLPAQRQVEGPADRLAEVDQDGAHAGAGQRRVRLHELVPEHGTKAAAGGAGDRASRSSGNGSNIIYVDWENDLVVVVRWIAAARVERFHRPGLAASSSSKP